jgi:LysR family nitrogen assimilation transcriptional regulator
MTVDGASIDLKRLRYFIAVCNHGGIARAASAIGVAQPALTRQIKLLEKEIGLTLVTRTGRGAEPTPEGRFLLAKSIEHLEGLHDAVQQLRQRFLKLSGHAVLGICPTISPFFLEDLKAHLQANCPQLSLSVIEAYSGDLKNLINRDRLDLAVTYRPSSHAGAGHMELFSEKLVLVSGYSSDAPLRSYPLGELEGLKLILPSRIHELRLIIDTVCKRKGILLRPDLELDSLDAVKAMLHKRPLHFFTILPSHCIRPEVEARQLSQYGIDDPGMMRTIAAVTPVHARNEAVTLYLQRRICEQAGIIKSRLATVF